MWGGLKVWRGRSKMSLIMRCMWQWDRASKIKVKKKQTFCWLIFSIRSFNLTFSICKRLIRLDCWFIDSLQRSFSLANKASILSLCLEITRKILKNFWRVLILNLGSRKFTTREGIKPGTPNNFYKVQVTNWAFSRERNPSPT